ncbi:MULTISPECIES: DNA-binding transcriptional regulator [Acetobacterium]|uniref:helix-turn-helix domain-containing protein n=1 Tax=Acetobacterium TaxID=33951 RepID=UPI0026EBA64D|nr:MULTISPECIES: helix-turn-helix transcriptional regulator [Acetobacterium]MDZ5723422.1 helix-turn-helix transcriptional regulator [Acetobacterium sp. K1/6]
MEFSEVVRKVREILDLSQSELADALCVSYATVNRWENKRAIPSKLAQKAFYEFCENSFIDINNI